MARSASPAMLRGLNALIHSIEKTGAAAPWWFVALFLGSSFLTIWRLEAMSKGKGGVEGTVLGTLVMPYCSGLGNLIFAFVIGRQGGNGADVLTNALVNNVSNLTLLIGLPALIWGMDLAPAAPAGKKKKKKDQVPQHHIHRLSLLFTLMAALFFAGATWALGRDGKLEAGDGLVLVGIFLFWQCFHVFEVLKGNVRQNKSFSLMLGVNLLIVALGAYGIYLSTDWLVTWISGIHTGFISAQYLGWLSGWLMVLPNGLLAFYYAWRGNPEVVYASQVGDGHICIPLCVGVFALCRSIHVPDFFTAGIVILAVVTAIHFIFIAVLGRLPRLIAFLLLGAYGVFVYRGIGK